MNRFGSVPPKCLLCAPSIFSCPSSAEGLSQLCTRGGLNHRSCLQATRLSWGLIPDPPEQGWFPWPSPAERPGRWGAVRSGSARCAGGTLSPLCLLELAACGRRGGDSASPVPPVLAAAQQSPGSRGLQGKGRGRLRLPGKDKKVLSDQRMGTFARDCRLELRAGLMPPGLAESWELSCSARPWPCPAPFLLGSAEVKASAATPPAPKERVCRSLASPRTRDTPGAH